VLRAQGQVRSQFQEVSPCATRSVSHPECRAKPWKSVRIAALTTRVARALFRSISTPHWCVKAHVPAMSPVPHESGGRIALLVQYQDAATAPSGIDLHSRSM